MSQETCRQPAVPLCSCVCTEEAHASQQTECLTLQHEDTQQLLAATEKETDYMGETLKTSDKTHDEQDKKLQECVKHRRVKSLKWLEQVCYSPSEFHTH